MLLHAGLLTALALIGASSAAAEMPLRIRGVVSQVTADSVTVRTSEGGLVVLKTGADATYAYVSSAALGAVGIGDYVGAAVRGPPNAMIAFELAIIPENMRAGRVAYYRWDPLPDPTASTFSGLVATSMTNGLVSKIVTVRVGSSVAMTGPGEADRGTGRTLTVAYGNGRRSFTITVPPRAPIVRYELADRSALTVGCAVVIKTSPGGRAGLVTIGRGVVPPM